MRKRLKNNDEVCHYWYNKVQQYGELGNMFFEGDSIYSYGKHFEIARHVKVGRKTAVLLSTRTYSPTTSQHCSNVRWAIPEDAVIIKCYDSRVNPKYKSEHEQNLRVWINRVNDAVEKLAVARKPESYFSEIEHIQAEARKYIDFFRVKLDKDTRSKLFPRNISKVVEEVLPKVKEAQKQNLMRRKEREAREAVWAAEREAREAEQRRIWELSLPAYREEFYTGKVDRFYNQDDRDESLLRIEGDKLLTSKGIEMPIPVAKRFYKKVMSAWKNGTSLVGSQILEFEIREFTDTYFRAGCHRISREEVERLTPVLG